MKNKKHSVKNVKCNWKSRKHSCGGMKYIKRNAKNKKHKWRSIKCDWSHISDYVLNFMADIIEIVILLISLNALMKLGIWAALCGVGIAMSFLLVCRNKYK